LSQSYQFSKTVCLLWPTLCDDAVDNNDYDYDYDEVDDDGDGIFLPVCASILFGLRSTSSSFFIVVNAVRACKNVYWPC